MTSITTNGPIIVLSNHHLINKVIYKNCVWLPARSVHEELPGRASWLEALGLVYEYDGRLFFKNGKKYRLPEIDTVFTDPQNRWMTTFLKADETGADPACRSHQFERLRLIELYCRLRNNDTWPFPPNSEPSSGAQQVQLEMPL